MCPSDRHILPIPLQFGGHSPAFDVLDSDRDGRISHDDLRAFCSFFAPSPRTTKSPAMISVADADGSGFIEFEDFRHVLPGGGSHGEGVIMKDAFQMMDRDGDGRVGFDDLKAYLGWAGMPDADDDVREMLRCGGCDETAGSASMTYCEYWPSISSPARDGGIRR
ncbi:hypothetical protein HPP92_005426 [Vanilla planifolia]|uniref:EF-hand domain-containing protein n=1 Tax=Vanilla planifolia TaxID=51239 RepID=A0A835RK86_VANPL|nr:hypothetical protein HPP92_005426 [Vanilla planifolia]